MPDHRAFRIDGEVIEVEITTDTSASLVGEKGPPDLLGRRFEDELSALPSNASSVEELDRLYDVLRHARSAVIGTTQSGFWTTATPLLICMKIALEAQSRRGHVPADVRSNPHGHPVISNPRSKKSSVTLAGRLFPPAVIVARDSERGEHILSLLSQLQTLLHLPLQVEHDFGGNEYSRGGPPEAGHIAVWTCDSLPWIILEHAIAMRGTEFILWDEAHRIFGSNFRELSYPDDWGPRSKVYPFIKHLKRRSADIRSVFVSFRQELRRLSLVKDELLGKWGIKHTFYDERSAEEDPGPRTSGDDRGLPPRRGQIWATFADLPGEIRNEIYSLILKSGQVFRIGMLRPAGGQKPCRAVCRSFTDHDAHSSFIFNHELGKWVDMPPSEILVHSLVNRQFAAETRVVFYATNEFHFDTVASLNVFIRTIGPFRADLRRVGITGRRVFLHTKPAAVFHTVAPLLTLKGLAITYNSLRLHRKDNEGRISPTDFAHEIKNFLVAWHEARKDASGASDVLSFVKIVDTCAYCGVEIELDELDRWTPRRARSAVRTHTHSAPCGHVALCALRCRATKLLAVRREVRERIAAVLGLEEREDAASGDTTEAGSSRA